MPSWMDKQTELLSPPRVLTDSKRIKIDLQKAFFACKVDIDICSSQSHDTIEI